VIQESRKEEVGAFSAVSLRHNMVTAMDWGGLKTVGHLSRTFVQILCRGRGRTGEPSVTSKASALGSYGF
jgi:hypothetical protein